MLRFPVSHSAYSLYISSHEFVLVFEFLYDSIAVERGRVHDVLDIWRWFQFLTCVVVSRNTFGNGGRRTHDGDPPDNRRTFRNGGHMSEPVTILAIRLLEAGDGLDVRLEWGKNFTPSFLVWLLALRSHQNYGSEGLKLSFDQVNLLHLNQYFCRDDVTGRISTCSINAWHGNSRVA